MAEKRAPEITGPMRAAGESALEAAFIRAGVTPVPSIISAARYVYIVMDAARHLRDETGSGE